MYRTIQKKSVAPPIYVRVGVGAVALGCGLYFYREMSMTVKELREALEGVPDDVEVVASDSWATRDLHIAFCDDNILHIFV